MRSIKYLEPLFVFVFVVVVEGIDEEDDDVEEGIDEEDDDVEEGIDEEEDEEVVEGIDEEEDDDVAVVLVPVTFGAE